MSWIQWRGETLPSTKDEAILEVNLRADDMNGPQQNWRFDLGHQLLRANPQPGEMRCSRSISVEIEEMGIELRDWRELSGLTIRTTPQWLAQVEQSSPYGRIIDPVLSIREFQASEEDGKVLLHANWMTNQYELRFGRLEGCCVPCELDAWAVIAQDDYYRKEPETEEELQCFAEGPPVLRVMTRACFTGGNVEMERCGDDPVPLAMRRLRGALGEVEVAGSSLHWDPRYPHGWKNPPVREPGWRSSVRFQTCGGC